MAKIVKIKFSYAICGRLADEWLGDHWNTCYQSSRVPQTYLWRLANHRIEIAFSVLTNDAEKESIINDDEKFHNGEKFQLI